MGVYIDDAFIPFGNVPYQMKMSHMIADSAVELHDMADRIGLNRKWFQSRASLPHYDVAKGLRQKAISAGAIPLSGQPFVDKMNEIRSRVASGAWDADPGAVAIENLD